MSNNFGMDISLEIITFLILIIFGVFIFAVICFYTNKNIKEGKYTKIQKNALKEKEEFTQNVINENEVFENDDEPIDYK